KSLFSFETKEEKKGKGRKNSKSLQTLFFHRVRPTLFFNLRPHPLWPQPTTSFLNSQPLSRPLHHHRCSLCRRSLFTTLHENRVSRRRSLRRHSLCLWYPQSVLSPLTLRRYLRHRSLLVALSVFEPPLDSLHQRLRRAKPWAPFVSELITQPFFVSVSPSFQGDVHDHESLVKAIKQVDVVISTIGTMEVANQEKIIAAIIDVGNVKSNKENDEVYFYNPSLKIRIWRVIKQLHGNEIQQFITSVLFLL
ncbi:hypothetical protein PIB30_101306, partial [Stylosanthes scabra]|nr:hypothetical protein [Stylosanthes scabra]